ncbi:MAG: MFS transporter [Chitinophagaceae bacterium]|nr:MFS transporter [Oligoflexus sp.]
MNEGSLARDHKFRLFILYRLCLTLAIQVESVGVAWHVYDRTRNPLYLGYVGLAIFLPNLISALPAGRLADLYPRRTIMIGTLGLLFLGTTSLIVSTLWEGGGLYHLYGTFVLIGFARAFSNPASSSYLPQLVTGERLSQAVAFSSTTFQLATIIGPAVAGLIFGMNGGHLTNVYAVALVLFVMAIVCLSLLPTFAPPLQTRKIELLAGLYYVWENKMVLGAISLDLFAVLLGGAVALLPVYAREILHVGPEGLGYLRSAPAVGAAITALFIAFRPLRKRVGLVMLWAVGLFGAFTVAFGLSDHFALSLGCLAMLGATDMISVVVRQTLIQVHTPDAMRGRVSAVNMVFIGASNELGEFESGVTASLFGTVPAVVFGGLGTIAVVCLWAVSFPVLRRANDFHTLPK